jgi:glycosyltransferase involved in cell wall biosynthesis
VVDLEALHHSAASALQKEQKAMVDRLAGGCEFVLMHYGRLQRFKNPMRLLDVAEHLPEAGVAFAGDGEDRPALEERVRSSPTLQGRVAFLGAVSASGFGSVAKRVSAFVLTSNIGNYNTSLLESMGLGIGPVVAVDTPGFPPEFEAAHPILRVPDDPQVMAQQIRALLVDQAQSQRLVAAATKYVEQYHSPDQMWAYRNRLLELAERYASRRRRTGALSAHG